MDLHASPALVLFNSQLPLLDRDLNVNLASIPKPTHHAAWWKREPKASISVKKTGRSGEVQPGHLAGPDGRQALSDESLRCRSAPQPRATAETGCYPALPLRGCRCPTGLRKLTTRFRFRSLLARTRQPTRPSFCCLVCEQGRQLGGERPLPIPRWAEQLEIGGD